MFRSARFPGVLCAVLSTWLTATSVAAQPTDPALGSESKGTSEVDPPGYRELVHSALEEYELGHFLEAKSLFLKAHALFPNARTLRVLGMAEFELRDYVAATELLTAALESPVRRLDADMRASVEVLLARAQGFTAMLRVQLQPEDAELRIDARPVALPASQQVRLAVGSHLLEARSEGYRDETRQVELTGGDSETLQIELSKLPSATRPARRSPWLWTALGVVVAGAVTGTVLALKRRDPGTEPFDGGTTGQVLVGPSQ